MTILPGDHRKKPAGKAQIWLARPVQDGFFTPFLQHGQEKQVLRRKIH